MFHRCRESNGAWFSLPASNLLSQKELIRLSRYLTREIVITNMYLMDTNLVNVKLNVSLSES
jgi:hypothetical protein